jgi:biotin-(acetyl-CoA carboxylase) ligase
MSITILLKEANELEQSQKSFKSRNDKIVASKKAKELILAINEFYKKSSDEGLMDVMKRITTIKRKLEKRLKGRPQV